VIDWFLFDSRLSALRQDFAGQKYGFRSLAANSSEEIPKSRVEAALG